ncbi:hypothetical protein niasHT_030881 [Heterodera trifolii]|uniref:Uncharacterized protein n=1 Tax=Heterodera trifolii TaxID=157864 RepID=A0ABD2HUZ0_9BILA
MPSSMVDGEKTPNFVVKKCRKLWRRLKLFNGGRSKNGDDCANGETAAQQKQRTTDGGGREGDGTERWHGDEQRGGQQHETARRRQSVLNSSSQLCRPRRRLPIELFAELCDCVPHHRLGLAKLVTSYSSCPVGLFGVHLTAQNGLPSVHLFHVSSMLTNLLKERREKMVGPIKKWNDNELEMYNRWKAESVHLITLLEEVKRLHASQ